MKGHTACMVVLCWVVTALLKKKDMLNGKGLSRKIGGQGGNNAST